MIPSVGRTRNAFSLLEVIIATAILAGSAMVLFSLISLGTKYGNRAEVRTIAISQAQSILDEFVAGVSNQEIQSEIKGVLPSDPPRRFVISVAPVVLGGSQAMGEVGSAPMMQTNLYRITVAIYESQDQLANQTADPLCELSRFLRRVQSIKAEPSFANGSRMGGGASR